MSFYKNTSSIYTRDHSSVRVCSRSSHFALLGYSAYM